MVSPLSLSPSACCSPRGSVTSCRKAGKKGGGINVEDLRALLRERQFLFCSPGPADQKQTAATIVERRQEIMLTQLSRPLFSFEKDPSFRRNKSDSGLTTKMSPLPLLSFSLLPPLFRNFEIHATVTNGVEHERERERGNLLWVGIGQEIEMYRPPSMGMSELT